MRGIIGCISMWYGIIKHLRSRATIRIPGYDGRAGGHTGSQYVGYRQGNHAGNRDASA